MTTCPIEFLYAAAMLTPDVISPMSKTIHYDPAEQGTLAGDCYLCGCHTSTGLPRKKAIKDTFTDQPFAKAPWSEVVCDKCNWALSYCSLRNYSIVASTSGLQHPSRVQLRETLLHPPEAPYLICIAESGQRWLHFKGMITTGQAMEIRFEDVMVTVRPERFAEILQLVEALYTGFTKDEILTGRYQSHRIQAFGLERWHELSEKAEHQRKYRVFSLALFLAQRPDVKEEA
jgi:CRISPR type IV-associated protein Csf1